MKYTLYIIGFLLSIASCTVNDSSDDYRATGQTMHPNDIILKNDTVLMFHGDSLVNKTGDSLNGRLLIQNEFQERIIDYKDGWVSSLKTYKFDSILTNHFNYSKGNLDGNYLKWHSNGNRKVVGFYSDGMADSLWTYYYSNGNLDSQGRYNPNYKIQDFEENDVVYDEETGDLLMISSYKDFHSSPDGIWTFHSFSGKLIKTMEFNKGTIVSMEFGTPER